MSDEARARVARAAGARLARQTGQFGIVDAVDRELVARHASERAGYYLDPVALGSLIVSAANLAWVVFEGLRGSRDRRTLEAALAKRLADGVDAEAQKQVITAVVEELLAERSRSDETGSPQSAETDHDADRTDDHGDS